MKFGKTNFRYFLTDLTILSYEGYRDKCCSSYLEKKGGNGNDINGPSVSAAMEMFQILAVQYGSISHM